MNHTKEPWDVQNKGIVYERSGRHEVVAGTNVDGSVNLPKICKMPDLSQRSYANAERIVACVNACAGINPEAVPKLLEVLQAITLAACIDCSHNEAWKNLIEACKAAIALAEQETK